MGSGRKKKELGGGAIQNKLIENTSKNYKTEDIAH